MQPERFDSRVAAVGLIVPNTSAQRRVCTCASGTRQQLRPMQAMCWCSRLVSSHSVALDQDVAHSLKWSLDAQQTRDSFWPGAVTGRHATYDRTRCGPTLRPRD